MGREWVGLQGELVFLQASNLHCTGQALATAGCLSPFKAGEGPRGQPLWRDAGPGGGGVMDELQPLQARQRGQLWQQGAAGCRCCCIVSQGLSPVIVVQLTAGEKRREVASDTAAVRECSADLPLADLARNLLPHEASGTLSILGLAPCVAHPTVAAEPRHGRRMPQAAE